MISNEQREARKLGIGGSDIPIILGLSSYKTPLQLYLEKKGIVPPDEKMSPAQEMGILLEPVVRTKFSRVNNVNIVLPDTVIHPFLTFMRGNLDGYIVEWDHILEIKSSGNIDEWGADGSDFIPLAYLVQIAYYCAIMNIKQAHLAVLIGHYGFHYRQYKYTQDPILQRTLIQSASAFWEAIQNDIAPEPINQLDLKSIFPKHQNGKSLNLSNDIEVHLKKCAEVKRKIKELKEIEEESQFHIMHYMEDAECLTDEEGRPLVTWKANKRGSRTFLLKGERE